MALLSLTVLLSLLQEAAKAKPTGGARSREQGKEGAAAAESNVKLQYLVQILEEQAPDVKTVIFSSFAAYLDIAQVRFASSLCERS